MRWILLLLVLVVGCASSRVVYEEEDMEIIATQRGEFEIQRIKYTRDRREFSNYFDTRLKPSLEWIKQNTVPDSIFLCWWDYGHMLRGYAKRDAVIYSPSIDILHTLASKDWNTEIQGEFSSREKIDDVVKALTTTDPQVTIDVMRKYNANYVYVTRADVSKSMILFELAGYEVGDYLTDSFEPTNKAMDTMLVNLAYGSEIEGFVLAYEDESAKVYWHG